MKKNTESASPIAGLICHELTNKTIELQIVRDLAWDSRITNILPKILKRLSLEEKHVTLECSQEDDPLNKIIVNNGWKLKEEKLLLGRSIWRRSENRKLINRTMPIEQMFGKLQPQRPPLPTPTLEPR